MHVRFDGCSLCIITEKVYGKACIALIHARPSLDAILTAQFPILVQWAATAWDMLKTAMAARCQACENVCAPHIALRLYV
jgi:hypothetical protein